jgi:hypothetical protein
MPVPAFVPTQLQVEQYASAFIPGDEVATPGFYGVTLQGGI